MHAYFVVCGIQGWAGVTTASVAPPPPLTWLVHKSQCMQLTLRTYWVILTRVRVSYDASCSTDQVRLHGKINYLFTKQKLCCCCSMSVTLQWVQKNNQFHMNPSDKTPPPIHILTSEFCLQTGTGGVWAQQCGREWNRLRESGDRSGKWEKGHTHHLGGLPKWPNPLQL